MITSKLKWLTSCGTPIGDPLSSFEVEVGGIEYPEKKVDYNGRMPSLEKVQIIEVL